MTISAVGSISPLLKQLEANGLTANKANLVQSDLAASQATATAGKAPAALTPSTRAAFNAKISANLLSGKLSARAAAAVRKTIEGMDEGGRPLHDGQPEWLGCGCRHTAKRFGRRRKGRRGGGGGASSTSTELSEAVTVSGATETTVITYTDGSASTTTTAASDADKVKYESRVPATPPESMPRAMRLRFKGVLVNQVA